VRGTAGGGGALSRHRLLEGETTGQRRFMGKLKRMRRRIFSFFHLALEGDKRRREERQRTRERWRWLGGLEVAEDPVGPAGLTAWQHGPIPERSGMGHKKEWAKILERKI
jgi:hypothetical protein